MSVTETETRCARGCCPSQAEHYRSVQIGTGELSPEVADINRRDKALFTDREAYKRLRKDGLQPASVDGSARLEQNVKDQIEIDYKIPLKESDIPRVKEIQSEVAAGNYSKTLPR
jgi:hypothetical protein